MRAFLMAGCFRLCGILPNEFLAIWNCFNGGGLRSVADLFVARFEAVRGRCLR